MSPGFRRRAAATVAAGVLATYAGHAVAQQALGQGVPVPKRAKERQRTVDLSAGVSATYDSNILRSSRVQAQQLGLRRADTLVSPTVDVNVVLPSGRNTLTLGGRASYDFNGRNSVRDGERINFSGGLDTDFRTCQTSLEAGFNRVRSDPGNFTGAAGGPSAFITNFETTTDIGGSVSCGRQVGISPFASINYSRGRNTAPVRTLSDYQMVSYGGGLTYFQPSIGEIGIVASIDETRYPERAEGTLVQGQPKFTARSVGVSFRRATARTLQAEIRLNYTDVDPGVDAPSFSGLSGEATLRFAPGGRIALDLRGARAAVPSLAFNVDYVVETSFRAGLTIPLSPKLNFDLSFDHRDRKYFSSLPVVANLLTDDSLWIVSGQAGYRLAPRLLLRLASAYERRQANSAFYDYDAARITLSA